MKTLMLTIFLSIGGVGKVLADTSPLDQWVREQKPKAMARLRDAISPPGAAQGSVYASPSRSNPDYYYHWVRDGALVMREIYETRAENADAVDRLMQDFIDLSRRQQMTPNRSGAPGDLGLGEPKFYMNGTAFNEHWGRPQNDGPALRAFLLGKYAMDLWAEGKNDYITRVLYRPEIPAKTVLKADLEFVAHHWRDTSFDLWEENRSDHFYTRMAQWRALEVGSDLARLLGDRGAADYYAKEAINVLSSLEDFWSESQQIIRTARNFQEGLDYKHSGLDISIILAVNHVGHPDGPFSVRDPRVIKTALALEESFRLQYKINALERTPEGIELGVSMGRYPEDRYDGYRTDRLGNPWFLATQGMAEFYYVLAAQSARDPEFLESAELRALRPRLLYSDALTFVVPARLRERGDAFFRRAEYHSDRGGHQAEQFHRDNGLSLGAPDLTWSYGSFLSAERTRTALLRNSAFSRFLPRSQPSAE